MKYVFFNGLVRNNIRLSVLVISVCVHQNVYRKNHLQSDDLQQPIAMQERQPIIAQRGGTIGRKQNSASVYWGKGDSRYFCFMATKFNHH